MLMINKMRRDTTQHPFEKRFSEQLKKAIAHAKTVNTNRPRTVEIPSHITPKFDDEQHRWGMFNHRLEKWVKEEYAEEHTTFRTEEQAVAWYRSLI